MPAEPVPTASDAAAAARDAAPLFCLSAAVLLALAAEIGLLALLGWACA